MVYLSKQEFLNLFKVIHYVRLDTRNIVKYMESIKFAVFAGFGLQKAIADADFYPNGGEKQPGCGHELGKHLFSLITGRIEGEL